MARKVLVVQNESAIAPAIEQVLRDLGYELGAVAPTVADAVSVVKNASPDLVLVDLELKGEVHGISVARTIRQCCNARVVLVSGRNGEETLPHAWQTAEFGSVQSPFDAGALESAIGTAASKQNRLWTDISAENAWLFMLLRSISDAVIATDLDALVRYLNPAAEALTGCRMSEAVGKRIQEIYRLQNLAGDPVDVWQVQRAIATMSATGKQRYVLRTSAGRSVPIEDTAAPILDDGRLIGAVSVFRDNSDSVDFERLAGSEKQRLEREVQTTTDALAETRAEVRALSCDLLTAHEEEARRIARELHDDCGQRTAIIQMRIERLGNALRDAPVDALQQLDAIREQVRILDAGLRNMSHRLHPSIVDDLGLIAALRALVRDFLDNGGHVVFRCSDASLQLAREGSMALYRIAQESMRNAAKHSPGAPVRLTVTKMDRDVQLTVEDAGSGFDLSQVPGNGGLGLLSMQERARLAGGTLVLRTAPGEGTMLIARVPAVQVSSGAV